MQRRSKPLYQERNDHLTFVNDLLISYCDKQAADEVKQPLKREYKMSDLGSVRRFLGMIIKQTDRGIFLSQETYIDSMTRRFRMEDAAPIHSPIA